MTLLYLESPQYEMLDELFFVESAGQNAGSHVQSAR